MAAFGQIASFKHPENGMTMKDMSASLTVANQFDEVIIFRSTGPWSRRWIEQGYPTKNFHVKGKSSDWGPQAGFVPYLGIYSKVGHDAAKAKEGKDYNDQGLNHHFAAKVQLTLSREELRRQESEPEEVPARLAIQRIQAIPDSKDLFLFALRSGDNKQFVFRAVFSGGAVYHIFVYPEKLGIDPKKLMFEKPEVLEVMTSSEVGAGNRPMTGDYDLMSVCPSWDSYGGTSTAEISKPGLNFSGKGEQAGLAYAPGSRMDQVLDMRINTGVPVKPVMIDGKPKYKTTFQGLKPNAGYAEHGDMGNLTPRILRCINALNSAMGATGPLRRVHHNAESHRNHMFGALTGAEMAQGDGFPLTAFQPRKLLQASSPTSRYMDVATLETLQEFKEYATLLNEAGYYVPRNWIWGMSIRNRP